MLKKQKTLILLITLLILVCLQLVACNHNNSSDNIGEDDYDGPYTIKLTAIGSTTIKAGKTLQLRQSITGTNQKDVVFESRDESIATVNDNGLVTGIKEGTVTIECSLVIEPKCKKSITIIVEEAITPTSIAIEGGENENQWFGETLQLKASVSPAEASELVKWSTSDSSIATVSETGLVTFVGIGEVTVTATSTQSEYISSSSTFNVKKGFFRSDLGSPLWNVQEQSSDTDPYISLDIDETQKGYHSCYVADVSATRYYVEATFKITEQISAWTWQGVGIGSGLSETQTRYFIFSPYVEGQGNDHNKFIVKDLPNDSWSAITTRSQTWGENGLNDIDWRNSTIKIALLRDNNCYYYLINDKLMYVDETTIYDEIPTIPIIVSIDVCTDVTDYLVITDEDILNDKLNSSVYRQTFYSCNQDIIDYEGNAKFTFKSNQVLSKDNKIKSIGDASKLVGDFEIEFDVTGLFYNDAHEGFSGITINLSRYEDANKVESFIVGRSISGDSSKDSVAGFYSWDQIKSFEDESAWTSYLETSSEVFSDPNAKHHIKLTRTISDNKAIFKLYIDGTEVDMDDKSSPFVDMTSNYTGTYILWIAGEYGACQVTNLTFLSNIDK